MLTLIGKQPINSTTQIDQGTNIWLKHYWILSIRGKTLTRSLYT